MRTIFISVLFLFLSGSYGQSSYVKFLVRFSDKSKTPYSVEHPEKFLSKKAIDRRIRHDISVDYRDLPVDPAYIDSIAKTGVAILGISKWYNAVIINTEEKEAINRIAKFDFVRLIDSIAKQPKPTEKVIAQDYGTGKYEQNINVSCANLHGVSDDLNSNAVNIIEYGQSYLQTMMIRLNYLHNKGYFGKNILIAVLDAGFWYADTIPAFGNLWKNGQILATKDFVKPEGDVFREHPHGMKVLSIMGANIPGLFVGTAPDADYLLLRSEDAESEYIIEEFNWSVAAEYADSAGADIINSSLGYTTYDDTLQNHTYEQLDGNTAPVTIAADIAASRGMLVIASAGNSGDNEWNFISAPGDADSVITVGAVDASGVYASFSSKGPSADGRIKPMVATLGKGTYFINEENKALPGNGTSFSSPILAGAAACLLQANPDKSNMQILEAIKKSASRYLNPDNLTGYGIPNFVIADLILKGKQIPDLNDDNTLNIFPNPFSQIIHIVFFTNKSQTIRYQIFDIAGREVLEGISEAHEGYNYIPLAESNKLSKGLFLLRIQNDEKKYSFKVLKTD